MSTTPIAPPIRITIGILLGMLLGLALMVATATLESVIHLRRIAPAHSPLGAYCLTIPPSILLRTTEVIE